MTAIATLIASTQLFGQTLSTGQTKYKTNRDILYRENGESSEYIRERCCLDLYAPVGKKNFITVIWFHGGGLTSGKRTIPEGLKGKGIAIVAAGYRLSPRVKAPKYIEDAAAAVAWTFKNIERYGGSAKRIFVSGHSAGGYLASMVVLDKHWLAEYGIDSNQIAGLVSCSGQAITHFTIRAERGIAREQPIIDGLAPIYHVRQDAPPILLITGDRESELLGRYEEMAYMWRMMHLVGCKYADLIELQGFDHGQMVEPAHALLIRFVKEIGASHHGGDN